MTNKRTVTSVELPPNMLYCLDRLANQLHLKKSDLIRWGIEYILTHPLGVGDGQRAIPAPDHDQYTGDDDQ